MDHYTAALIIATEDFGLLAHLMREIERRGGRYRLKVQNVTRGTQEQDLQEFGDAIAQTFENVMQQRRDVAGPQ